MTERATIRAGYEMRLALAAGRMPRACVPSIAAFLACASYLFIPIDIIPDRTPWIGHLDETFFMLLGLGAARALLPREALARAGSRPIPGAVPWRRHLLAATGFVAAPAILRLCLGRWADDAERTAFVRGFAYGERVVPPILRGLHEVPAAKEQLGQTAVLNLIREGVIRKPRDLGRHRIAVPAQSGNPLSYWRGPNIAFLHIEKTAGVALASVLTEMFHPLQIDRDPAHTAAPHVVSAFVAAGPAMASAKSLVWGHYDLPALRRLDPGRRIVTVLREPKARILSLYHFWRSVEPELAESGMLGFNVAASQRLDLLSFLRSDEPLISNYIDNVYARRLTGAYATAIAPDPLAEDPDRVLAEALWAMNTLDYVGLVEEMKDGLAPLGRAIGVELPRRLPRRNATDANHLAATGYRKVTPTPVTPEIEAELDRLTRLDAIIYRRARSASAA